LKLNKADSNFKVFVHNWELDETMDRVGRGEYTTFEDLENAEKVRAKILATIKEPANHPGKYPGDKYRLNNDGSYRAFRESKSWLS
jgi:hypothetical protein